MITVGVVLDDWKLDIFQRHLDAAGFSYTQQKGPGRSVILLKIEAASTEDLSPIILAANTEAANCRKKLH